MDVLEEPALPFGVAGDPVRAHVHGRRGSARKHSQPVIAVIEVGRLDRDRRFRRAGVVMSAFVLVGCSAGASPAEPSATSDPIFAEHLAQAEAGAAGERQVEVLREAARTGELTFEAVNDLVQESFECMAAAGIGHEEWEPYEVVPGYRWPAYSWQTTVAGMSDEQATTIGDACLYEHSYYAEMALQDRRNYAHLLDAQMRRDMPEILACLEENGVRMDSDATLDEIRQAAIELGGETTAVSEEDAVWCYEQMPEVWQD